jgi:peptide/nickel transport system ATP-binding protein
VSLLAVDGLTIRFGDTVVVHELALEVGAGERVAVIGESGSGKTLTTLATLGLLPPGAVVSGSVRFDGEELLGAPERRLAELRGGSVAMVFQNPQTTLDPLMRVGRQVTTPLRLHRGMAKSAAAAHAVELLDRVGLPDPDRLARSYPHQLSGGQRQRVGIAMAIACQPRLLIADEPTSALDVTVQAEIVELVRHLVASESMALLFVTHDLALVPHVAERVVVMRHGRVVETGPTDHIVHTPEDPYTRSLLEAARSLSVPEGTP